MGSGPAKTPFEQVSVQAGPFRQLRSKYPTDQTLSTSHMLLGLLAIVGFLLLGEFLVALFGWPIPGSAIGLILSLGFALARGSMPQGVESGAQLLISRLSLFIIPASVGLLQYLDLISRQALPMAVALLVSLFLGIPACALIGRLIGGGNQVVTGPRHANSQDASS